MNVSAGIQTSAGTLLVGAFAMLAVLHGYWAVGGRWGLAEALGGPEKPVPASWLIWAVTGLLMLAGIVICARLGFWSARLPRWVLATGCWLIAGALVLAAVLNYAGATTWERLCFGPIATLLAAAAVIVALSPWHSV